MIFKRVFVIVTDSMGIGEAKDSVKYNDTGANTFGHIADGSQNFNVSTLERLGIGNICKNSKIPPVLSPLGVVARMHELSVGKDTLTGHFEIMGLNVLTPYPSFTDTGFPDELIKMLEDFSGRKVIGNISASGTEILKDLGEEQLKTGALIVYTSADSVLQIAANEEIIPLEELYRICEYARRITIENKDWQVGRIIARPFVGKTKDTFKRTTNRHDYALDPFDETVLDTLKENNLSVIAVGKINDIFNGKGVTKAIRTVSNHDGMEKTTALLDEDFTGLCFTNLVDFDALYGHRRDLDGYRLAIEEFDKDLKCFIDKMNDDDLVIVVADHGNDPVHHGTDHTREIVPFIAYSKNIKGKVLPDFDTFACVGATIADNFNVKMPKIGKSVLEELK
ncbi:MAG: phosphopentomutase [Bacilli bacterium]|nr:phosphopentomutase [Bacilli bacterium]